MVNESGLYSLIMTSRKPQAKAFKKWVTSEVLPMIRKTGGYVNNDEMFVNTYLAHADDATKMLFKSTL
ncbi:BRO-N domain-containing protein [Bacillus toyonensis]|uniref:BRO-N domain-containing protein n=1 Tax=Bacillus toyonensis TaxID=155322 RepID=UPI003D24502D